MKVLIARDENLASLQYAELWHRMFDQKSEKSNPQHFYNVLLVVSLVFGFAIDTSICERGFSTMNTLKTARRSVMGTKLLRILMVLCSLADDWKTDPANIPVADIIETWRDVSKKGRYLQGDWRAYEESKAADAAAAPAPAPQALLLR